MVVRLMTPALLVVLIAAGGVSAQTVGGPGTVDTTTATCDAKPLRFHRHRARQILRREYRVTYYSTHELASKDAIERYREHKQCIRIRNQRFRLANLRQDLAAFQHDRIKWTPYAGGGVYWAIPYYVVTCESGADYSWPAGSLGQGGAYGLLDSWWVRGGRQYADVASNALPWQQDQIAHRAWVAGDSWACA